MEKANVPRPYQSPLHDHWEQIKALRKKRKTWAEIAEALEKEHGLKTSYKTVQNFFRRMTDPKRKVPMGFEDPEPSAAPSQPARRAAQPDQGAGTPKTKLTPEEAEAECERRIASQRQARPFPLLNLDEPEK